MGPRGPTVRLAFFSAIGTPFAVNNTNGSPWETDRRNQESD